MYLFYYFRNLMSNCMLYLLYFTKMTNTCTVYTGYKRRDRSTKSYLNAKLHLNFPPNYCDFLPRNWLINDLDDYLLLNIGFCDIFLFAFFWIRIFSFCLQLFSSDLRSHLSSLYFFLYPLITFECIKSSYMKSCST